MRILLIGARGQLGADLREVLGKKGHEVRAYGGRAELDVTRPDDVRRAVAEAPPDALISTAAFHLVDACEAQAAEAFRVNALAQKDLAEITREAGAAFVFFSTDYVFGGDPARRAPYREEDGAQPVSAYGASKLAGEALALAYNPRAFVFRVCGLYGARRPVAKQESFAQTMLRLAREGKPIRVVNDQRCAPTFTEDVAMKVVETLEKDSPGLYHSTNSGDCTWFEFAREIFRLKNLAPDLRPCATSDFPRPARRPAYSVLESGRLRAEGLEPLRPWQEALGDYLGRF